MKSTPPKQNVGDLCPSAAQFYQAFRNNGESLHDAKKRLAVRNVTFFQDAGSSIAEYYNISDDETKYDPNLSNLLSLQFLSGVTMIKSSCYSSRNKDPGDVNRSLNQIVKTGMTVRSATHLRDYVVSI